MSLLRFEISPLLAELHRNPDKKLLSTTLLLYAIAHIRGGGEMGRTWYEDGKFLKKRNTFTDFIACARHLVDYGWVAKGRLAARGGSAGGLLMGAVANLAPTMFDTKL